MIITNADNRSSLTGDGPSSGDALVEGTKYHATGSIPCAMALGQPTGSCPFGVIREGNGNGIVTVTKPDGRTRAIFFKNGKAIGADVSQADPGEFSASREGDLTVVRIGDERYEIPDALIFGGWRTWRRYQFADLAELTEIGKQLGEEEWYITKHDISISNTFIADDTLASQYSFRFICQRHLSFYIFRIFVPLILIIAVSWVTFFLKDYAKRIDISGANLLVFIAFNFTIGLDLPRLGYLTLLDTILIVAFVVTTLTVIWNVVLKRLDTAGKTLLTQKIDRYILWGYMIFYVFGFLLLALIFLLWFRMETLGSALTVYMEINEDPYPRTQSSGCVYPPLLNRAVIADICNWKQLSSTWFFSDNIIRYHNLS
jgi:hypothetical protein